MHVVLMTRDLEASGHHCRLPPSHKVFSLAFTKKKSNNTLPSGKDTWEVI
jgi:hypothetical protein